MSGPASVERGGVNEFFSKLINAAFIATASDSVTMNMRQQFMVCILAFSLIATLGATAAEELASLTDRRQKSVFLDPRASDRLLASRLNVTIVVRTPRTR